MTHVHSALDGLGEIPLLQLVLLLDLAHIYDTIIALAAIRSVTRIISLILFGVVSLLQAFCTLF